MVKSLGPVGRAPHGECGLKYVKAYRKAQTGAASLPAWGVWIEIGNSGGGGGGLLSLPAWGVWIEMDKSPGLAGGISVAPRMGSVD